MLSAFRLCAGEGLQRGGAGTRFTTSLMHRRILFKNLRDDRMAHWLCPCRRRMDSSNVEGSGPFNEQSKFNCPGSRDRGFQWSAGFGGDDAGRVLTTPRVVAF